MVAENVYSICQLRLSWCVLYFFVHLRLAKKDRAVILANLDWQGKLMAESELSIDRHLRSFSSKKLKPVAVT